MASKKAPKADPRPLAKDGTRRGGARLGAGRKTAAATKAKFDLRQAVVGKITARYEALVEAMFDLALGTKVADSDEPGGLYVTAPDRQAGEYLLNQGIGKPHQAVQLSGPEGEPIKAYIGFDPDDV